MTTLFQTTFECLGNIMFAKTWQAVVACVFEVVLKNRFMLQAHTLALFQ